MRVILGRSLLSCFRGFAPSSQRTNSASLYITLLLGNPLPPSSTIFTCLHAPYPPFLPVCSSMPTSCLHLNTLALIFLGLRCFTMSLTMSAADAYLHHARIFVFLALFPLVYWCFDCDVSAAVSLPRLSASHLLARHTAPMFPLPSLPTASLPRPNGRRRPRPRQQSR